MLTLMREFFNLHLIAYSLLLLFPSFLERCYIDRCNTFQILLHELLYVTYTTLRYLRSSMNKRTVATRIYLSIIISLFSISLSLPFFSRLQQKPFLIVLITVIP